MNDEIKEILEKLTSYKYLDYKCKQPEDILTMEDVWLLLDYITNLQHKINKAIEYIEDTYMFDYENDDRLELKDQWYAKDILNILKGDRND